MPENVTRQAAMLIALFLAAPPARAQFFDPLSLAGRALTVVIDARTASEVKTDVEISAGANKRLLDSKEAEWKSVSLLVFAQHVVLAGAVQSERAKKLVEKLVREDKSIRSLTNDLVVVRKKGDEGSFVADTALDTEINAVLTAAKGVSSVNMRWKAVNGNVILMGITRSKEEAKLAVEKIKGLKSVKAVKSRLRVVPKKSK